MSLSRGDIQKMSGGVITHNQCTALQRAANSPPKWTKSSLVVRQRSLLAFLGRLAYTADMNKQHVTLTDADRESLEALLAKGSLPVKTVKRATALLELDRGKTLAAVAATLDVDYNTVAAWRNGYRDTGLACLHDAPRPGRPIVLDGGQRAKITALACSDAPE